MGDREVIGPESDVTGPNHIILFWTLIHSAGEYYPRYVTRLAVFDLSSVSTSCAAMLHAAESLDKDEVPQDLIDMTARAADDTGRDGTFTSDQWTDTSDKKRQRTAMADLAERFERESDEWHKRYEDLDAQVANV